MKDTGVILNDYINKALHGVLLLFFVSNIPRGESFKRAFADIQGVYLVILVVGNHNTLPYDIGLLTGCRVLCVAEILPVEPDPTSIGVGMSVNPLRP